MEFDIGLQKRARSSNNFAPAFTEVTKIPIIISYF